MGEVVVFDNLSGKLFVVIHADPGVADAFANGCARLQTIVDTLRSPLSAIPDSAGREYSEKRSSKEEFLFRRDRIF